MIGAEAGCTLLGEYTLDHMQRGEIKDRCSQWTHMQGDSETKKEKKEKQTEKHLQMFHVLFQYWDLPVPSSWSPGISTTSYKFFLKDSLSKLIPTNSKCPK